MYILKAHDEIYVSSTKEQVLKQQNEVSRFYYSNGAVFPVELHN